MSAKTLRLTLEEVLTATHGRLVRPPARHSIIEGITTDSRDVPPGSLFVGVPGERFDGSDFAAVAADKGAAAVIASPERAALVGQKPGMAAVVSVPSPMRALGLLAHWHRRRMPARLVAVTGSNGKTTAKEMVAAALSEDGATLATEGNLNNEIGAPLTLFGLRPEHRYGVIELGMNHEGEIGRLTAIAAPNVGLVTMAAAVHTEALRDVEGVSRAKGELYHGLPLDSVVIANADDLHMRERARWAGRETIWFGIAESADVRLLRIVSHDRRGLLCVVRVRGQEHGLTLPVVGTHNAINACGALAAALAAGAPLDSILKGLARARPPGRRLRLNTIPGADATLLDDCYNANPSSMFAALDTLMALAPAGHRIAVLGDMRELGEDEINGHRAVGAAAARSGLKLLVAFGPVSTHIAAGAVEEGLSTAQVFHTDDPAQAAERVRSVLKADDLVLVKASRGTRLERVSDLLVPPAPQESR